MTDEQLRRLPHDWTYWARDDQRPPPGAWRTWLVLGGRGAGKTRTGAEWVRALVASGEAARIALVAPTLHDAREVMIEGPSGLRGVAMAHERPLYVGSRRRLEWPSGAVAHVFSAEDPESLRGPQFHAAWCDEFAAWPKAQAVWDMLQMGLRLGPRPRAAVTTTPRAREALKRLLAAPDTAVTRAATSANYAHLSTAFLAAIEARYAGTELGRQELEGELIEDPAGALWRRAWIEETRIGAAPAELDRVVVGVDPAATSGPRSDACGIVVAARVGSGRSARGLVLADRTQIAATPLAWARAAARAHERYQADAIVAEANQGGDMVRELLRQAAPRARVIMVHASRGKRARAEPIAALYEQGRVAHVGALPELEDELCAFGAPESRGCSPDRADALVWALSELLLKDAAEPALRSL